uniref:Transcriptional regulator n=1 Tax=Schistosoma mansoni TaxID=6183 RepID=A0A5K4FCY2_SCHMA
MLQEYNLLINGVTLLISREYICG